jgi:Domain of unknown function (DUF4390)
MTRRPARTAPGAGLVLAVLGFTALLAGWAPPAAGATAADPADRPPVKSRIDHVAVTRAGRVVTVSAQLSGGFPPDIADQIQNGVPKDLFYTVTLNRRHRNWFDEEMASATVRFQIKYDTLAGRYRIRRVGPEGDTREQEVADYAEAVRAVSHIEGVRLVLPKDVADYSHYVSAKAEMRAVKMPLYLDYVFFFIPRLEFETPWARTRSLESPR